MVRSSVCSHHSRLLMPSLRKDSTGWDWHSTRPRAAAMFLDISMPLDEQTQPVPGHPAPVFNVLHTIARDAVSNTVSTFSLHTGTHVDAPAHMLPGGRTIDQVPVEWFIREGVCLDLSAVAGPRVEITTADLREAGLYEQGLEAKALLLATGWADTARASEMLYRDNPYLSHEAAAEIADQEPRWIGL